MKDLEKYIRDNKEALQERFEFKGGEKIWHKLENELNSPQLPKAPKKGSITISFTTLKWMAAAVVLLVAGYWSVNKWVLPPSTQVVQQPNLPDLKKINPELAEAEVYYTSLIETKKQELSELAPEDMEEFNRDLKSLDSLYISLKNEFYKAPYQEAITYAMIQNLRLRMEILDRQIQILEKFSTPKKPKQKNESQVL